MSGENGNGDAATDKSRIHIKLGSLEIEFEGSEAFLENHLPNLVELLGSIEPPEFDDPEDEAEEVLLDESTGDKSKQKLDLSTSTIATMLDAKSGRDLVLAACAHLRLVKGHEEYERKNIVAEMRTASSYFKKTYVSNLTTMLQRLVKAGDLNEIAENTYALSEANTKALEATLSAK